MSLIVIVMMMMTIVCYYYYLLFIFALCVSVCVVTAWHSDMVAVSGRLRWAARHGRVVCLPDHTHDQHTQFTLHLMTRVRAQSTCQFY